MDTRYVSTAPFQGPARFALSALRLNSFAERGNNKGYQPFRGYALDAMKGHKNAHLSPTRALFADSFRARSTPLRNEVSTLGTQIVSIIFMAR